MCPHGASEEACPLCLGATHISPKADSAESAPAPLEQIELEAGDKVGRYVVLELVGEGGMGVVYAAYDPQLDRRVAIKLLRAAAPGSGSEPSDGQARLLREAQAMAQLSHPNVVPVYDVGQIGDSVFVAMEFVSGQTLWTWAREKPRPWKEILAAYLAAGAGLAAAHRVGMVHRDFKPANVLVGADGRTRVTDFGLARSAGAVVAAEGSPHGSSPSWRSALTQVGALMGTIGYMAPEQLEGEPATFASDQFAFCVSLWEALYGKGPFAGSTAGEVVEATLTGRLDPPPRDRKVPQWIHDTLVRGLARDPAQRVASLDALLATLSRDPARRARRWAERGVGLAVALAALGSVAWMARRQATACTGIDEALTGKWDPGVKARAAQAFASSGKGYAERAWRAAETALDGYARDWVEARTDACRATRVRHEQSEPQMALRLACLDRRLTEFSTLTSLLTHADLDLVEHAGSAVAALSPVAPCADVRALEDPSQALPPGAREEVRKVQEALAKGRALLAAEALKDAHATLEPALATAQRLHFAPLDAEAALAAAHLAAEDNHFPETRAELERAAAAAEVARDDRALAQALVELVSLVGWIMEKPQEGRSWAVVARGAVERVGDKKLEARLDKSLGDVAWEERNFAASVAAYRHALTLTPDDGELHYDLGYVLVDQDEFAQGHEELERALTLLTASWGPDHPQLAQVWNAFGNWSSNQDDWAGSIHAYERCVQIVSNGYGEDSPLLAAPLLNLAYPLAWMGRVDEALAAIERAERLYNARPERVASDEARVLRTRANVLAIAGRYGEALTDARRAAQGASVAYGVASPMMREFEPDVADVLDSLDRFDEALPWVERSFQGEKPPEEGPTKVHMLEVRGTTYLGLHRLAAARSDLQAAFEMQSKKVAKPMARASVSFALARALGLVGPDGARAAALAASAAEIYRQKNRSRELEEVERWLHQAPRAGKRP